MKATSLLLPELLNKLWHTTSPERFNSILVTGAILPEPDIPEDKRWKTSQGSEYYPFVRSLGGVSLFDFDQFDPETYGNKYPMSSWYEFVPYQTGQEAAIWIEIDRQLIAPQFISGPALVEKWNSEGAHQHSIMPYIEAAHIGPLPRTSFSRALLVRDGNDRLTELDC